MLARFEPVAFNQDLVNMIQTEAESMGLTYNRMPSGAGHDAQIMARTCPATMIFVPSVNGLSHNICEFTKPDDLVNGAQLLLNVVMKLADRL